MLIPFDDINFKIMRKIIAHNFYRNKQVKVI